MEGCVFSYNYGYDALFEIAYRVKGAGTNASFLTAIKIWLRLVFFFV